MLTRHHFAFCISSSRISWQKISAISLLTTLFLFVVSCADNTTDPVKPAGDINELVRNAGELSTKPQSLLREEIGSLTETITENDNQWVSNSKKIRLSNKFDEIVALNSAYNDALYPGALIQGKDIVDGKLTSIGDFAREPITLTINNSSEQIVNPNKATVEEGIGRLVKKAGPSPANILYYKEEMYSTEQAFLELGLSVGWLTGSVSTKFQKEKSVEKNSVILYFKQVYYTASVNTPSAPADVFAPSVSVADLQQRIYPGNPACYISQVQYGRIILAKITSEQTIDAMASALEAAWTIVGTEGRLDKNKIKFNCSVEAIVLGGSASGAANAVTAGSIDDINRLIKDEAVYSPSRPAYPIAYTVRYLSDGSPVKLGSTIEYTEQNWKLNADALQRFDLYFSQFDITDDGNLFTDGDFYYTITVKDSQGKTLRDGEGNDAVIELFREEAKEVGSGGKVLIDKWLYGITVRKQEGENITIHAELFDRYSLGEDVLAGVRRQSFSYPWSTIPQGWQNLDLVPSEGSYKTRLVFKIEKK
jgi:hypothetical protein